MSALTQIKKRGGLFMVNVKIDEDTLLFMLVERVKLWTESITAVDLFTKMYESYIDGGVFDGMELNIDFIVDNDCVNYCSVVEEGDENYNAILKVYEAQGLGDCSCEDCDGNFIEAISDDKKSILIRW